MTLLSLEQWRKIISYNPFHFWGLANDTVPVNSRCNDVATQYAWQNVDAAGRAEILEAIENAEARLAHELGYWPAPRYASATLPFPQHQDAGVWRYSQSGPDGRWLDVRLPEGYVQAIGTESLTLLGEKAVTLSDADGDGLDETWTTAAVATTETDPGNIAVYFAAADRLDSELDHWRIQPVKVTIAGGSVTVTGKAWQIVKPILYEGVNVGDTPLDPDTAANFAATLAVYVRKTGMDGTTAATSQAKLIWETLPYPAWATCCNCGSGATDASTDPAATAEAVARAGIRDSETGIVSVGRAVYNATTGVWESVDWGLCRPPARATVRYLAGYPLTNGEMDRKFQTAVARLAAAELARKICACDMANRELYRWQFDMARSSGNDDESYAFLPQGPLDNPFGTRRGHIYAWKFVQDHRNLIGFAF